MAPISQTAQDAAVAFLRVADSASGERSRFASAGALVLRTVEQALLGAPGLGFLAVRSSLEVAALAPGADRALLQRILLVVEAGGDLEARLAVALVEYAYQLERTRRLPEADATLRLAVSAAPHDAEVALHGGRVARKMGDRERALVLYRTARDLDGKGGAIARLAAIGEAVVDPEAERALGRATRAAVRAEDAEAAAVGLEERARLRRASRRWGAAARDLVTAALRYPDPVDRARAAHDLADLALAMGDLALAREALLFALRLGDAPQRDHARSRLHVLSRDLGDEVGTRRWRAARRPALVSLSLYRAGSTRKSTLAARLARWRFALEQTASA